MSREAMQLALEALEQLDGIDTETECVTIDVDDVITALRQALETEQAMNDAIVGGTGVMLDGKRIDPAAIYKQEPVAWINWNAATGEESIDKYCDSELASVPLYCLPKNFSPLTDEQILEILPDAQHGWTTATYGKWVARAVERCHGIRGKRFNNVATQEPIECLCGLCKLGKRELTCVCGAVWEGETMVHPPRDREWVGLTNEEIIEIAATPAAIPGSYVHSFACAIEAKLKDKNG